MAEELVWGIIDSDNEDDSGSPTVTVSDNNLEETTGLDEIMKNRGQRKAMGYSVVDFEDDTPRWRKPDSDGTVSAAQPQDYLTRRKSKWAVVNTSYLPKAGETTTRYSMPRDNKNLTAFGGSVTPSSAVAKSSNENGGKWGVVKTSYLPTGAVKEKKNQMAFNVHDGVVNSGPIVSKTTEEEESEAMEQIIANKNYRVNDRDEVGSEPNVRRWATIETGYVKTVPERKSITPDAITLIKPVIDTTPAQNLEYQGCYLSYDPAKNNGQLTATWSRNEIDNYFMFFKPGPSAHIKGFMYNQKHQVVFQKDLKFTPDKADRRFLNGVMEFLKMAKKYDSIIRFSLEKLAYLRFKIYFITEEDDVIDLLNDRSVLRGDEVEIEAEVMMAVALLWNKYDDLKGFKKSTTEIFVDKGNQKGNLAMALTR
mmetsp:Transcript_2826/g.3236  ORF Transcript_2826/g.3236 Transcript_2826/m.3236 type:complete len:423 (-) Transcript_2826:101-1369(-)|eukprot:CAMPEP_0184020384 /NCGR_PEP_ID=MMETSP0954-20121128/9319_1 /TAXON_ID=627963 /ORGANISM="Aplanochytrium sp, Strain PBS07" /LENGTH=422 /DNA_ID=CAMNT_0026302239 /DNA_START=121 /DNA_END=1389 /DNA_ORIENTATION=-